jgi:hypothetical protein
MMTEFNTTDLEVEEKYWYAQIIPWQWTLCDFVIGTARKTSSQLTRKNSLILVSSILQTFGQPLTGFLRIS